MPWETVRGEPPRGLTTVPERAIVFREINGDKVATGWLFVLFKNQLTIALIMSAYFKTQQKVSWLEEIELNFDASFQQILTSELKILWEARSTPTLDAAPFST
jgi:hypothetical protein